MNNELDRFSKLERKVKTTQILVILIFIGMLCNICLWFYLPIYMELTKMSAFWVSLGDALNMLP